MRYAQCEIAGGLIVNTIKVADGGEPPTEAGFDFIADPTGEAAPGGTWDGMIFHPPPVKTPGEIDADMLARIVADWDAADAQVALELQVFFLAALRELVPDIETKAYFPAWLAGVTDGAGLVAAVAARQLEISKGGK